MAPVHSSEITGSTPAQNEAADGQSQLTEVLGMIEELHNVADLCRNEGATDIAYMLNTAADMIDALKGDVLTLTRRLMGENKDSFAPETLEVFDRWNDLLDPETTEIKWTI